MDTDQLERVYELKEEISDFISDYLNEKTKHISAEEDELLRTQLQEQFRFWRKTC